MTHEPLNSDILMKIPSEKQFFKITVIGKALFCLPNKGKP